ncbi:hypothetical protein ACMW09_003414 [Cronobacter malonaticus]|nr:hypothetical protein [Cronobacter sakazakii]
MNVIKVISIGKLSYDELKKIHATAVEKQYSIDSNFGFEIIEFGSEHLECQFVEKVVNERVYENLDGVEEKIEYVDYYKMQFILRSNSLFSLCLVDPPRNTTYGLKMIRSLLASNAKIQTIEFDLAKFFWGSDNNRDVLIRAASIANLKMDNDILAKVKLVSNSDISEFIQGKYKKNTGRIDSLTGVVNGVAMEISKLGRLKVSLEKLDEVLELLEVMNVKS